MNCTHLKAPALFSLLLAACPSLIAQNSAPLDLKQSLSPRESEMRIVIQRYEADRDQLSRFYMVGGGGRGGGRGGGGGASGLSAPSRFGRMKLFYNEWQTAAQKIDTSKLVKEAAADKQKLLDEIKRDQDQLDTQYRAQAEILPAVPFASIIFGLEDGRRKMEKPDAEKVAIQVSSLTKQIAAARKGIETGQIQLDKSTARRGVDAATTLRTALRNWNGFYNDYDPMFTWWMAQPYKEADKALGDYVDFLRERSSGDETSPAAPKDTAPVNIVADKPGKVSDLPDLNELLNYPQSEMRGVITRFNNEAGGGRGGGRRGGGGRNAAATKQTAENWLAALAKLDFDSMTRPAQVDYLLLKNRLEGMRDRSGSTRGGGTQDDTAKYLPFDTALTDLTSPTRPVDKPDSAAALTVLKGFKQQVEDAQKAAAEELKGDNATAARRSASTAARNIPRLQGALKEWFDRNESADNKWAAATSDSYVALDQALGAYGDVLRGPTTAPTQPRDTSDFAVLPPVGRDELLAQLKSEMIIYTPEELIARAEKEFAWCESEMKKASRQMGLGDDWKKALEKVKNDHVKEGDQPYLIAFLMREAVEYITEHKMITIPIVASETLQMEMMSPQRQLVNPFFTGGALISVSYPTDTMTTDAKEQSMRGNNIDFARATVFHEMLPGHNFQGYNASRYYGYRRGFGTPFWGEGWACYWELLLYQQGFPKTPENKIGMLFWRMHRCARIQFSLKYQLGEWTPKQCIDFLVDRVGHERENATAEVRRSFEGGYAPLYQCAYLLGAMQLLELHKELVESGKMTERAFHDAIIQGGSMPIAMVRAGLTKEKLTADYKVNWRF